MRLQLSTWPEIEHYLTQSTGIIIPIGSTEQHGPNGLIGTDAICPETIAYAIAEEINVLIAPTIHFGMAHHHLGFPGTISLRPATLMAVVTDIAQSLSLHGFRYLYFLNGHGGNAATVNAAFADIYAQYSFHHEISPIRCKLVNWWSSASVHQISKKYFGEREGYHATPSEVSLSFYAYPQAIKTMPPTSTGTIAPHGVIYDAIHYRKQFNDGRIGSDPSLATPEIGQELLQAAVSDIKQDYLAFVQAVS